MLPEPLAGQVDPAEALHVQLIPLKVAGNVSVTVAPVTLLGPLLVTVMVYVTDVPGAAVVCPSVLVTARSACGVRVSVSVALLLLDEGSTTPPGAVTVAVLLRVPVAPAATVAVTV
jgi:hypothetical protein